MSSSYTSTSNGRSVEGMSPHLQDWTTRVVTPQSVKLLTSLKERQTSLENDAVHERMDQRLKDMTRGEREDVAQRVSRVLCGQGVNPYTSRVQETLDSLRDTFRSRYDEADYNATLGMASEGVLMKEAIHWLEVMWATYEEDVNTHAYEVMQRHRRFIDDKWMHTLTFNGAMSHKLFVDNVDVTRRMSTLEYQLWNTVVERLIHHLRYPDDTSASAVGASTTRYKALARELATYGWMHRPQQLSGALRTTAARLEATTRTLHNTQRQHKDAIHWIRTIAAPRVSEISDHTRSPAEAQLDSVLSTGRARQQQLRTAVVVHIRDTVQHTQRSVGQYSKDEFMARVGTLLDERQRQNNIDDAIDQYLRQYRRYRLDRYSLDVRKRLDLIHDNCLTLTQDLLDRPQRVHHTQRITDALQSFQQELVQHGSGASPEEEEEEENGPTSNEEQEARLDATLDSLHGMKDAIEAQLSRQDEDATTLVYLSKLLAKLRSSSESMMRLSQTQWRSDTASLSEAFLASLPSLNNDQTLTAFWEREQAESTAVNEANHKGLQADWTRRLQRFTRPTKLVTQALDDALSTHNKRVVECVSECMETYLKRGTTGDMPSQWLADWLAEPTLAATLTRLKHDLQQREKQLVYDKEKALLSITRLQLSILKTATTTKATPTRTTSYADIDAFFVATHCALLMVGS